MYVIPLIIIHLCFIHVRVQTFGQYIAMISFDGLLKELQSNFLMSEVLLLVHDINNGTMQFLEIGQSGFHNFFLL